MQRGIEFTKCKDGRLKAIIGEMECFTPPMPKTPDGFLNGHVKKKADQRWKRDFPDEEEIERLSEYDQEALRTREALRLLYGAWFLNDGEPTYLTPDHYMFLTHFQLINSTYPDYREVDGEDFLWTMNVEADEQCIGGVFMGARQRGKTARRACRILRLAMVTPGAHLGIQSKTDDDAREVLNTFISHALRNMSPLIKPVTSLTTDDPKTEIEFKAPARRGKTAQASKKVRALNSRITRKNSKPNAYDGRTPFELLSDEWAKKQDYDTEERMTVMSRPLWRGGKRIGRIWMYSTIDEKEDFEPEMPERVWNNSNPNERNDKGRTETGLVRLFIPSYKGHIMDEYGRSLIAESIADLEASCPKDPIMARRYWRANPRTVEDGLSSAGGDSILNLEALNETLRKLRGGEIPDNVVQWGNFAWTDETRTAVKFDQVKDPKNGRFCVVRRCFPDQQNHVESDGYVQNEMGQMVQRWKPLHDYRFAIGIDPYDAKSVAKLSTASKGAAYCFWKYDSLNEEKRDKPEYWPSDSFIVEYVNRPPRPIDFYEDMIKLCHFFGCKILPERQKPGIIHHFQNRGYAAFVNGEVALTDIAARKLRKKKGKQLDNYGHAASVQATEEWAGLLATYSHGRLVDDFRRMPFPAQVKDWLALNVLDTQKNDAAVASGWTLMLARQFTRPPRPASSVSSSAFDLRQYFNF
ncbi:hypothetical protein [Hymenobacter glacieicola]|uniref:Terminase n=1 Tax=Hymenobacter glacieicola TaxID=1562124 RepID=A0ABQ1X5P0_9BACT|nr:hypothetical protein [Hymenobacter glacieicola]GGG61173.1 hypothetical protein GCM10011378_41470 [Hymenobacter glacieicola]